MIRILTLLLAALLLNSCGIEEYLLDGDVVVVSEREITGYGDPEVFEPYRAAYEVATGRDSSLTRIMFGTVNTKKATTIGTCHFNQHIILIDGQFEKRMKEGYSLLVEALIIHELGHCDAQLDHTDLWLIEDDHGEVIPGSIMNAWMVTEDVWENNRETYIDQLNEMIAKKGY